jgi:hypothetical protein
MLCRRRDARRRLERAAYDAFVRAIPPEAFEQTARRNGSRRARPGPGRFRSLEECFARVNARFFAGALPKPELCWSPRRSRRLLASYQERSDRVIVSRLFDSDRVPLFILDYLMYHELLHKRLGIGRRADGKRHLHGAAFRQLERRFDRYAEAAAFLRRL